MSRRFIRPPIAAILAVVVAVLAGCDSGPSRPEPAPSRPAYAATPNVVFVLTDDLSSDLVPYMPHVVALQQAGMTFTNYTVTDSLCCPSRASIFTGKFPHNTHVRSNGPRNGGMAAFRKHGGEQAAFAPHVQRAGYRTALLGKYLNGYIPGQAASGVPDDYIPPGWSTWAVGGAAYRNYDYTLNENGRLVRYGSEPKDYLTSVIAQRGVEFINRSVADRKPFLLELATYAPHSPFTPEPRDAGSFATLRAPRPPSFDRLPVNAPLWMSKLTRFGAAEIAELDRSFARRVEAVQSVDRAVGRLQTTLRRTGQWRNTVFVFSSDNGFHLGQHRLRAGKRTAFDTDVRVPLVVAGPGIRPGSINDASVQNIDLAPTFQDLAGATRSAATDGRSIVALLHGTADIWRTRALVEHARSPLARADPDRQPDSSGNPPTYASLRTSQWTYVRYADGSRELYDRRRDPDQLVNVAGRLAPARVAEFDRQLDALTHCRGAAQCWTAGAPEPVG